MRFLSAVTAPLCFYEGYYGTGGRACQGPAGLEIVKKPRSALALWKKEAYDRAKANKGESVLPG